MFMITEHARRSGPFPTTRIHPVLYRFEISTLLSFSDIVTAVQVLVYGDSIINFNTVHGLMLSFPMI